jgi:hypothetical protein
MRLALTVLCRRALKSVHDLADLCKPTSLATAPQLITRQANNSLSITAGEIVVVMRSCLGASAMTPP